MQQPRRSLPRALALRGFGWVLVLAGFIVSIVSIACSSGGGDSAPPAEDGGAQDGASDAGDAGETGTSDPTPNTDPIDNGYEPSLDIVGSWIYFDNNQPWVRVEFNANWPPPATLSYWSCAVSLGTANAPVATYTAEDFNGTRTDSADGVPKAKVTFAAEPKGFRVLFADATLQFNHYGLETSVKTTNDAGLAQDTSGAFAVTTKVQRTFGP